MFAELITQRFFDGKIFRRAAPFDGRAGQALRLSSLLSEITSAHTESVMAEPLSYNKYLRVPELIGLQECQSDPAHHDELLFITVHQAYELWFKQALHEIDAALCAMREDRAPVAARAISRVVEIEKLLVTQIHILETMTPINFLSFRDQLNPASGFQSMQFREIEFASGLKDDAILSAFQGDE